MKETETVYEAVLDDSTKMPNNEDKLTLPSLKFCLFMDLVGLTTYILPAMGEWADLLWAPISGYIFMKTFSGMTGKVGGFIALLEEILPFTDFIPTYTIGYFYTKHKMKKKKTSIN